MEFLQRIGDVAVNLEERSGVQSKETMLTDIAPVAKEAGYSVEEFSAIAAVAQQRSGLAHFGLNFLPCYPRLDAKIKTNYLS